MTTQYSPPFGWREFGRNTPEGNEKAMGYLNRATQMGSLAPLEFEKLADLAPPGWAPCGSHRDF